MMRSKLVAIATTITAILLLTGGRPIAYGRCSFTPQSSASNTDKDFTDSVLKSWMLEMALAKEAAAKSGNPDVRTFANRVIQDNCIVDQQLTRIAQKEGLQVPGQMGSDNEKMLDEISRLDGLKFDRAYITFVITDHLSDIKEFSHEAMAENNPAMGAFASQMVPLFRERLSRAESINRELASAGQSGRHPWWKFWKKV